MNNYSTEVLNRWGKTDAFVEHTEKTKNYTTEKWETTNHGLMEIFAEFSILKNKNVAPDSAESQSLVSKLQSYITANYYTCTNEILAGLGEMYVADERFKKNIDKSGEGTAEFVSIAIKSYLK